MLLVIDNYDSFTYNLVQYLGELGESIEVRRNDQLILGVCLGHQAIGEAYGARVVRASKLMHGKTSRISHDGKGIFEGLPSPLEVMRYHSLVIEPSSVPAELEVIATAVDDASEVHAVRHKTHPVWGVQFHPESVLTSGGRELLRNFLKLAK